MRAKQVVSMSQPKGLSLGIESDPDEVAHLIPSERHRAHRFPLVAGIQVTDVVTEKQIAARTQDSEPF